MFDGGRNISPLTILAPLGSSFNITAALLTCLPALLLWRKWDRHEHWLLWLLRASR
jgi:hypothetical protein